MKKILAVYDEDEDYGRQLAEYVNRKEGIPFRMMAFTSLDKLEEYVEKAQVELVILPEGFQPDNGQIPAERIVTLTERPESGVQHSICKYQPAGQLLNQLLALLEPERQEGSLRDVSVVGVYSPVGRCGKTTFALLLGQILARSQSVLYISLEEFSAVRHLLPEDTGGSLSDAYFYSIQGMLKEHMRELTGRWHELEVLPGVVCPEDLHGITSEAMEGLVRSMASFGMYDTIIIDMGCSLRVSVDLLGLCSIVYVPEAEGSGSENDKLELFFAWLEQRQLQGYSCHTQRVRLPWISGGGTQQLQLEYQLWGEAGDYIRSLIKSRW